MPVLERENVQQKRLDMEYEKAYKEAVVKAKQMPLADCKKELSQMEHPSFLSNALHWVRDRLRSVTNMAKIAAMTVFLGRRETSKRLDQGTAEMREKMERDQVRKDATIDAYRDVIQEKDPEKGKEYPDAQKDANKEPDKGDAKPQQKDKPDRTDEEPEKGSGREEDAVIFNGPLPNEETTKEKLSLITKETSDTKRYDQGLKSYLSHTFGIRQDAWEFQRKDGALCISVKDAARNPGVTSSYQMTIDTDGGLKESTDLAKAVHAATLYYTVSRYRDPNIEEDRGQESQARRSYSNLQFERMHQAVVQARQTIQTELQPQYRTLGEKTVRKELEYQFQRAHDNGPRAEKDGTLAPSRNYAMVAGHDVQFQVNEKGMFDQIYVDNRPVYKAADHNLDAISVENAARLVMAKLNTEPQRGHEGQENTVPGKEPDMAGEKDKAPSKEPSDKEAPEKDAKAETAENTPTDNKNQEILKENPEKGRDALPNEAVTKAKLLAITTQMDPKFQYGLKKYLSNAIGVNTAAIRVWGKDGELRVTMDHAAKDPGSQSALGMTMDQDGKIKEDTELARAMRSATLYYTVNLHKDGIAGAEKEAGQTEEKGHSMKVYSRGQYAEIRKELAQAREITKSEIEPGFRQFQERGVKKELTHQMERLVQMGPLQLPNGKTNSRRSQAFIGGHDIQLQLDKEGRLDSIYMNERLVYKAADQEKQPVSLEQAAQIVVDKMDPDLVHRQAEREYSQDDAFTPQVSVLDERGENDATRQFDQEAVREEEPERGFTEEKMLDDDREERSEL